MRRLRTRWALPLAGAALVGSALVGRAGALPAPPPLLTSVTNVQCPTTTLCLGIAGDGGEVGGPNLIVSRAPRSRRWTMQSIDGGRRLRVLTCRSARWCLAVDQQNQVLISTDRPVALPAGGWLPEDPVGILTTCSSCRVQACTCASGWQDIMWSAREPRSVVGRRGANGWSTRTHRPSPFSARPSLSAWPPTPTASSSRPQIRPAAPPGSTSGWTGRAAKISCRRACPARR
jgi:hypothetical protein